MMAGKWLDSIGREHPEACGFIAVCPDCGALMHTHSLSGKLEFNEQGWGVWSENHAQVCQLARADGEAVTWHCIKDQELYRLVVDVVKERIPNREARRHLSKKMGFSEFRKVVNQEVFNFR